MKARKGTIDLKCSEEWHPTSKTEFINEICTSVSITDWIRYESTGTAADKIVITCELLASFLDEMLGRVTPLLDDTKQTWFVHNINNKQVRVNWNIKLTRYNKQKH